MKYIYANFWLAITCLSLIAGRLLQAQGDNEMEIHPVGKLVIALMESGDVKTFGWDLNRETKALAQAEATAKEAGEGLSKDFYIRLLAMEELSNKYQEVSERMKRSGSAGALNRLFLQPRWKEYIKGWPNVNPEQVDPARIKDAIASKEYAAALQQNLVFRALEKQLAVLEQAPPVIAASMDTVIRQLPEELQDTAAAKFKRSIEAFERLESNSALKVGTQSEETKKTNLVTEQANPSNLPQERIKPPSAHNSVRAFDSAALDQHSEKKAVLPADSRRVWWLGLIAIPALWILLRRAARKGTTRKR